MPTSPRSAWCSDTREWTDWAASATGRCKLSCTGDTPMFPDYSVVTKHKPATASDFSSSVRVAGDAPMLVYLMMSPDSVPSRVCEPPGRSPACFSHSTHVQMAGGGASPTAQVEPAAAVEHAPLWHIILLDDDDHTYEYVIEMLGKLFGYSYEKGMALAKEVDANGRVIVETTYLERAEFKRDQIHSYGRDWRITRSKGSMSAILEPAA